MSLRCWLERTLTLKPLPFQVEGIRRLLRSNGRIILGDDMGLGKTYQSIAYLRRRTRARPAVICTLASLKWMWQSQLRSIAGLRADVLSGRKPYRPSGDIWILNWEILPYWSDYLRRLRPAIFIPDEAHRTQNRNGVWTKACQRLARATPQFIPLTGTPISRCPAQIWPLLNMIARDWFPSFWRFAFRYCDPKMGYRGHWDYSGASNLHSLHRRLDLFMVRRTKDDVLKDLPPKMRQVIPVEIDNRAEYEHARDDFADWWSERQAAGVSVRKLRAQGLVKAGALRRIIAVGKVAAISDWIENWLKTTDEKLVVFTRHKITLSLLRGTFRGCAVIEGATPPKKRDAEVRRFQTDAKCRIFLGNIQAAGEGLTLTAASTVVFAELMWVPTAHEQAEDRVRRIGQTKPVSAYYFIGRNTVEEAGIALLDERKDVICRTVEGRGARASEIILLASILKESVDGRGRTKK